MVNASYLMEAKNMKIDLIRRKSAILLVLGLASIFVLEMSILPGAQADKQFTNESIEGTWGYSASGNITAVGPAVAVGLAVIDGKGGCSLKETFTIGSSTGAVMHTSTACTYDVNPDGTGNLTVVFGPPFGGTVPVALVIVNKGNEIFFIRTDPGVVVSGVAKRQKSRQDTSIINIQESLQEKE